MPELMMSHHLVISKAGGAIVQEAIAARCPMIVNQVIPGQEEGNAELIWRFGLGAMAEKNTEVAELVENAFAKKAAQWYGMARKPPEVQPARCRAAHRRIGPGRIRTRPSRTQAHQTFRHRAGARHASGSDRRMETAAIAQMLLCDFHIHTNYSDGKLSVPEIIDFYGERGFDCICITDHLADPKRLIGKLSELANMTLARSRSANISP